MNPAPTFLALSIPRRALAFEQAATSRGLNSAILEKDFWVSWLLGILFAQSGIGPHLVFKGGTSLSKVFGAIDRFSEDVDLSVSPEFVGADTAAIEALPSRTKRGAAMAAMQDMCCKKARDSILPMLEVAIRTEIGERGEGKTWLTFEIDKNGSPVLLFHYPATQTRDWDYLPRIVKLELGALTDQYPAGSHTVRPWIADEFPAAFADWRCEVTALEIERTFWEKATILHSEYHRPADQPMPDRYARHYSDMARLLDHPGGAAFLANDELCARVVNWKSRTFPRAWAQYEMARRGSFKLVPPATRYAALEQDYAAMRPMFLHEPPVFDRVLGRLAEAERALNGD